MDKCSETLCEVLFTALTNDKEVSKMIADNIFPLRTKEAVKGGYIVIDSFETVNSSTKDGVFPESLSARLLCVDKTYSSASALAASVESVIKSLYIPQFGDVLAVVQKKEGIEGEEFLQELIIKIDL
jgi:hypothetical protein